MASITLTFSAEHEQRIRDALEETFNLVDENGDPRPAVANDLKQFLRDELQNLVRRSERRVAASQIIDSITDIDVT